MCEHGLYSTQVSEWRRLLTEEGVEVLEPKRRGRPQKSDEQREKDDELTKLRKEKPCTLTLCLAKTHTRVHVRITLPEHVRFRQQNCQHFKKLFFIDININ